VLEADVGMVGYFTAMQHRGRAVAGTIAAGMPWRHRSALPDLATATGRCRKKASPAAWHGRPSTPGLTVAAARPMIAFVMSTMPTFQRFRLRAGALLAGT